MRIFRDVAELQAAVGDELGTTEWFEITQERVDAFAEVTGDHQWIHVDRERAAQGPFGTTVAHGYLTLALIPQFIRQVYRFENVRMGLNYGLNRVRFPSPLPVGSRIRAGAQLVDVTPTDNGAQLVVRWTVEREGGDKPVCVADSVSRIVL